QWPPHPAYVVLSVKPSSTSIPEITESLLEDYESHEATESSGKQIPKCLSFLYSRCFGLRMELMSSIDAVVVGTEKHLVQELVSVLSELPKRLLL
ncbi:hypothetical protein STEG23_019179, partial [Scotinomys teguina]